MVLDKRYCVEDAFGNIDCYRDGFWYTEKGLIVKWIILASFFGFFMLWFVGGYIHARQRMKKGLPLLGYHRFLVSYPERRRYGQPPQNHFTFYNNQQPYGNQQQHPAQGSQPYQQRQDGAWAEPPPLYMNNDAPPQYFAPPGATKTNPNQSGGAMEMPRYGAPMTQGPQQYGVVGSRPVGDVEQGSSSAPPQDLPPRPPQQAKVALKSFVGRFKK